jgi:hypothetical protein
VTPRGFRTREALPTERDDRGSFTLSRESALAVQREYDAQFDDGRAASDGRWVAPKPTPARSADALACLAVPVPGFSAFRTWARRRAAEEPARRHGDSRT